MVGRHHESFDINVYEDKGNFDGYNENTGADKAKTIITKGNGQMVEQWACVQGCPVAELDEQSGDRRSAGHYPTTCDQVRVDNPTSFQEKQGPLYADSGGASRYFKQGHDEYDIIEYLRTMISIPDMTALVLNAANWYDEIKTWGAGSLCGLVVYGEITAEQVADCWRLLPPGGHLMRIAPDTQPTGHSGAILLEDAGFEIRDCILWVRAPGKFHYVAKAGRKEREAGCHHLEGKAGHEAVDRKEGSAGVENPRAGAGRTAKQVKNFHPCLHPDALVMTEQGYRPISEIQQSQKVYGSDGQFHPVDEVSHHPYTSEHLYEIAVQGTNYTTLASDNHPFLIWRPLRKRKAIVGGNVVWVEAQDIQKGDYTMTPLLSESGTQGSYSDDWWWVFGLWLAEGVLQRAGHGSNVYPSFTLHQDETDIVDRLHRFFDHRGFNVGVYPKSGSKAIQVIGFDSKVGAQFRLWSPTGAANKRLPPMIWQRQRSVCQAVFEGYMAGDGGKVRTYRQAKTVSPDLASQIRLLGEALGTKANLFRYKAVPGKVGQRVFKSTLPSYQIRFYDRDMNQQSRKPARPVTTEYQGTTYRLSYVQKVTPIPYAGDVWNLTIRGCPTFQTAVGMSHNTVKPISLMKRLLADVPKDIGPVLDPFMGSGATGVACSMTGHNFIGIERDPKYLAIADARVNHWDRAYGGWNAAEIVSDHEHVEEVVKAVTLDDLFGWGE